MILYISKSAALTKEWERKAKQHDNIFPISQYPSSAVTSG